MGYALFKLGKQVCLRYDMQVLFFHIYPLGRIAYVLLLLSPILSVAQTCGNLETVARLEEYADEGLVASDDGSVIIGQVRKTGEIKVWSSNSGKLINKLNPDTDSFARLTDIVLSSNGAVIAARLRNRKTAWVGDTFSGKRIAEFSTPPFGNSSKIKISPDGKILLTGNFDEGAAIWDISRKRLIGRLSHPSLDSARTMKYPFLRAAFSPDSKIVAASFWGYIYLWESNSGAFINRLYAEGELSSRPFGSVGSIYDLEFSPDGTLLAAAGRDGKTQLLELDSGDVRASLVQGDRVFSVRFSGDGKAIATVSYDDRNIKVWETDSGKLLYTVKGGKSNPFSVTFSKPETGLIAIPMNRSVEFREIRTGKLIRRCDNFFGYFLPSGVRFIAGLGDRGMALFRIARQ